MEYFKQFSFRWLLIGFYTGLPYLVIGQSTRTDADFDFKGRLIVSVSDADMVASAYLDGQLGRVEGKDALSVIRLDKAVSELKAVEIPASNSVTGPPSSVAVSPDGHYAIVIETRGGRPLSSPNTLFSDLPSGKVITVIDLTDPDHLKIHQKIDGPQRPLSVTFSKDGSLVVITYRPQDANQSPLAMYQFTGGKLANLSLPDVPGYVAGDIINGAVFHPVEPMIALLNVTKSMLVFFKLTKTNDVISLTIWGNSVVIDKEPFKACFTPNGRFVVVNAMYPGSVRGSVTSVGLSIETASDGSPVHQIVSRALAGVLPEGLTMSPDGRWVVTTNLEQSTQPFTSPKQGFFASLSLMHLNPESGLLSWVGDFPFDGILPESVVFDNSGRFLAVANFDHYDLKRPAGSIDFWRLTSDYFDPKRVQLVKTNYSVPVTRGVHSMVIVR